MVSVIYLTWSSFNNIRLLLMASKPIVMFYLIWLVNTSESIRSEEGSLLDLVCWPDGNAIPVIVACVGIIAVIIQIYGLYQLFKAGLPRVEYNVTSGLFYYIWALIIIIILFLAVMFYSGLQTTIIRAKIKGGITKAMLLYASHLPSKVAIDQLQTHFHCCGRVQYQEWFYIPWYTSGASGNVVLLKSSLQSTHKFVSDNVPYSCCSMDVMQPCVHHRVAHEDTVYKYNPREKLTIWEAGCEEKLINEMMTISWRLNAVMGLITVAMIFQGIAVRYLHTAYRSGLHIGNQVACEAYLLRSVGATTSKRIEIPRNFFRKKNFRHSRTLQWVKATYTPRKIKSKISTSPDMNSSEELLKQIDGE
ncbi:photoreceptor outer segment membrane glycoprotein 2-like isoform X2 [Leguminivora glycinivorella]|uniref:photoreceptor outer segment membrane glycoprotein 2-like isoform X2 n=1 Tax=Leguminivora glycinivorella TaxID=1035111 RepID=UPI00200EE712|nr:photoreceptor outer segment membrane glycoprotein 2-like isoform X2 [Leguminivora glycinivorella]